MALAWPYDDKTIVRKWLIVLLVLSCVLRLTGAIYLGDQVVDLPGTADQISYHTLAIRVLDGHGFTFPKEWWPVTAAGAPTAHWSFLYTLYLVGVYTIFGPHPLVARLIQALIVGLFHPWLAYLIGRRTFSEAAGLAGAGITALYAYFVYYAGALMTESFYITAILGALYLAILLTYRQSDKLADQKVFRPISLAILLGVALGAAVLLRQLFLLFVPILFLWILWVAGRKRFVPLVITGLVILAFILPITWFNYIRFGRFVLLNTNAGYAFYLGNHPIYGTRFIPILPSEMYIQLIPPELRTLDEAALDQELLKRGLDFIKQDPGRYLLLSLSRIPAYFMFWPSSDSGLISNISRVGSFGLFLPFMLYGIYRAFVLQRKQKLILRYDPAFLLVLFAIVYTGIHLLSWALIRYRLPVDAVLTVFGGLAITDIYQRIFVARRAEGYSISAR
ncbi:MAG TPA: glycosyltransferase family 39 protein [Anaerolineales bacterium]|nr:glycosyltransferase family 39 protein [Anaerolineales bacterium]